MKRRRTLLLGLLATLPVAGAFFLWPEGPNPADPLAGAYRADGELILATVRAPGSLRVMSPTDGWALAFAVDGDELTGTEGFGIPGVVARGRVERDSAGQVIALTWTHHLRGNVRAEKVPLREEELRFRSGELELAGLLLLPAEGSGPFPVAIAAHGSGRDRAIKEYRLPYLAASAGMAGFVFDKRGTGSSEGSYTQSFPELASDVVAAAAMLRQRPDIDGDRVSVVGYSQGGWIATLAASMDRRINAIVSNFGVALPVLDEDRWGYVWSLRHHGFGDTEIAEVDEVNGIVARVVDDRDPEAYEALGPALESLEQKPYIDVVRGSDSTVGFLIDTPVPLWALKAFDDLVGLETLFGEIDRHWDPRPRIRELEIPSLWQFAGDDSSAPSQWSVAALEKIRASGDNEKIEIHVIEGVEHGMLTLRDPKGKRELTGYAPGYELRYIDWLRQVNGLD